MKKIIFIALLFCTLNVFAQQPGFTGTWQLNKTKTKFGQAPEWVLPKSQKVTVDNNKLTIERIVFNSNNNKHVYTESLPLNGQPGITTTPSGNKETGTLQKTDQGITLSFTNEKPDSTLNLKITEKWSLQDEGKTLFVDRFVEQSDGSKYELKAYYDKK